MRRLWISFDLYFFVHVASQFKIHRPRSETTWRTSGVTQVSRNFVLFAHVHIVAHDSSHKSTFSSLFRFPRVSPGVESAPGLDAAARKLNSICSIWHQIFTDLHRFTIFIEVPKFEAISSSDSFPLRCIRQLFWISVVQKLRISHGEGHRHRRRKWWKLMKTLRNVSFNPCFFLERTSGAFLWLGHVNLVRSSKRRFVLGRLFHGSASHLECLECLDKKNDASTLGKNLSNSPTRLGFPHGHALQRSFHTGHHDTSCGSCTSCMFFWQKLMQMKWGKDRQSDVRNFQSLIHSR